MAPPTEKRAVLMTISKSILDKKRHSLTDLPTEVMVNIIKLLHMTDCASLALSCKHLGRIVMGSQTMEFDGAGGWRLVDAVKMVDFFSMLQKSWVPKDLKRCKTCGKFQSTDVEYWKVYKSRRCARPSGGAKMWAFWTTGKNDCYVDSWCKELNPTCPVCSAIKHA